MGELGDRVEELRNVDLVAVNAALDAKRPKMTDPYAPKPCQVCGQPRGAAPLRNALPGARHRSDEHDGCDKTLRDWQAQVDRLGRDPEVVAALVRVDEATAAAEEVWAGKVRGLGLPQWWVEWQILCHDFNDHGCGLG